MGAVVAKAQKRDIVLAEVTDFEEIGGRGLSGVVAGKLVLCGSQMLLERSKIDMSGR